MFLLVLAAVLVAAAVHALRAEDRSLAGRGELVLVYLLFGYCGVPMLAVSVGGLLYPERIAAWLGFPAGNPFQTFLQYAYLGMSLIAVLTIRYRGAFLIGPAVCWAVFFAGATMVHLHDIGQRGALTHGGVLVVFATHGLISVLLLAGLLASGLLRAKGGAAARSGAAAGARP